MLSSKQCMNNDPIKNKGFADLDAVFTENGLFKAKNELDHITFAKFGHELDQFEIRLDKTSVHVVIPLKNSSYRYTTSFNNYFEASEYMEKRFKEYIA